MDDAAQARAIAESRPEGQPRRDQGQDRGNRHRRTQADGQCANRLLQAEAGDRGEAEEQEPKHAARGADRQRAVLGPAGGGQPEQIVDDQALHGPMAQQRQGCADIGEADHHRD
jgi:hypothetical protein